MKEHPLSSFKVMWQKRRTVAGALIDAPPLFIPLILVLCLPWKKMFCEEEENYAFLCFDLTFLTICRIVAQTVEKFGRLDVLVFLHNERFAITLFVAGE